MSRHSSTSSVLSAINGRSPRAAASENSIVSSELLVKAGGESEGCRKSAPEGWYDTTCWSPLVRSARDWLQETQDQAHLLGLIGGRGVPDIGSSSASTIATTRNH